MRSILLKENIIEICKNLNINSLLNFMQCNKYCYDLVIENKILDNTLIQYYKTLDKDDIVDMISSSYPKKHYFRLFELCLAVYPRIIRNEKLIRCALENTRSPDILIYLLKKGLNPNGKIYGYSYLHYAVGHINSLGQEEYGNQIKEKAKCLIPIIETLLEAGANPDEFFDKGSTLFHVVCNGKYSQCLIETFLIYGADHNIKNNFDETPFDYLDKADMTNIIKRLSMNIKK